MLLSDLVNKNVYAGVTLKGKCVGVGISLKTYAVKYLLCSSTVQNAMHADFCVSVSAVEEVEDDIYLSRLRPAFPKNCAKVYLRRPIYLENGAYLGNVQDVEIQNYIALRLFTDQNKALPLTSVAAFSDAVILKKEQPYPIGQRIPAPLLSLVTDKNDGVITKQILRTAIEKKSLVKLTLSLPPFYFDLSQRSHSIFRR